MLLAVFLIANASSLAGCGATLNNSTTMSNGLVKDEPVASLAPKSEDEKTPAAASAQLAKVADTFTSAATPGNSAYKIGPLDVLDISVFKVPELSRTVQVSDVGTINLPLVGETKAAGRTAREVERDLTAKLGAKYLQSPQVTVLVKEYNSQRVTVEGAVKKPGVYPLRGKTSLLQFVAMVEGLNDVSDPSNVVVFRAVKGKRTAARFDVDEIRAGRVDDPIIQEGDIIVVNESAGKAIYQSFLKALPITSVFMPIL